MTPDRTTTTAPLPVPELSGATDGTPAPVSDDDRNRYGALLDSAAERGLLSPAEYQVRLVALADAGSEDELRRIVTELPLFAGPAPDGTPTAPVSPVADRPLLAGDPAALDSALWANLTPSRTRRTSSNPWAALAVVVVVLLVAIVALALVGSHLAHAHHVGAPPVPATVVSRLRL